MIKGLYETHINVRNLEQSIDFYNTKLGLKLCHIEKERRIAFFWVGNDKQQMLGLWESKLEPFEKRHFAFECSVDFILNESISYLKSRNIVPYNFLKNKEEKPMVFSWMPAIAIYFLDPDGNELEFIAILDGEAKPELGVIDYEEWLRIKN